MDYTKAFVSAQEKQQLDLFNLLLECSGWEDPQHIEWRLDHGQRVPVLGMRTYATSEGRIDARFHAGIAMISIDISTKAATVRLHCAFGQDPLPLLETLAAKANELLAQPHKWLYCIQGTCEDVLQEHEDHKITRISLSSLR